MEACRSILGDCSFDLSRMLWNADSVVPLRGKNESNYEVCLAFMLSVDR